MTHTFIAFSAITLALFNRSLLIDVLRLTGSGDAHSVDIFCRFLVYFKISCLQIVNKISSVRRVHVCRTFDITCINNKFLYIHVLNTLKLKPENLKTFSFPFLWQVMKVTTSARLTVTSVLKPSFIIYQGLGSMLSKDGVCIAKSIVSKTDKAMESLSIFCKL